MTHGTLGLTYSPVLLQAVPISVLPAAALLIKRDVCDGSYT